MPVTRQASGAIKRKFRDPDVENDEPEGSLSPPGLWSEAEDDTEEYEQPPTLSNHEGLRRGPGRPKKTAVEAEEGAREPESTATSATAAEELNRYGGKKIPSRVAYALSKMDLKVPAWLKDTAKKNREQFSQAFSENLVDELPLAVSALQQVTFDTYWTQKDEDELNAAWYQENNDCMIDSSCKSYYRKLWTWCLAFMKCTPWDIAGIRNGFLYQRSRAGRPKSNANSIWTPRFCEKFACLIPHIMWKSSLPNGRAKRLAVALQYAVVLRTNDQRPWNLEIVDDEFLREFKSMLMEQSPIGPINYREIHAQTKQRLAVRGKELSAMSDLFIELEAEIETPEFPLDKTGEPIFVVTLNDIRSITNALDNMKDPGTNMRMFCTTEVIAASATEPVKRALCPSYDQVEKWHELAMKDQLREMHRLEQRMDEAEAAMSVLED